MHAADIMAPAHEIVHPDHPLTEALARVRAEGSGMLPVVDGDELVGVVTAEDASRPGLESGKASTRDVMSTEIVFCYDHDDLQTVQKIIEKGGHPRLLVLNEEWELVGSLTADAVREALAGTRAAPAVGGEPRIDERRAQSSVMQSPGGPGAKVSYKLRPTLRPRG